jgi:hypothetical protein
MKGLTATNAPSATDRPISDGLDGSRFARSRRLRDNEARVARAWRTLKTA